jgi:hypothetical protein
MYERYLEACWEFIKDKLQSAEARWCAGDCSVLMGFPETLAPFPPKALPNSTLNAVSHHTSRSRLSELVIDICAKSSCKLEIC